MRSAFLDNVKRDVDKLWEVAHENKYDPPLWCILYFWVWLPLVLSMCVLSSIFECEEMFFTALGLALLMAMFFLNTHPSCEFLNYAGPRGDAMYRALHAGREIPPLPKPKTRLGKLRGEVQAGER